MNLKNHDEDSYYGINTGWMPTTDQALTLFRNGAVLMDEASHYGDHGEAVPQKTSMASKL